MIPKILWTLINKPRNLIVAHRVISSSRYVSFTTRRQCTVESKPENLLNYNAEESEKILKAINCSDLEQLLNYDITRARARKLQSWKNRNGPLRSTQDMLVEGLSVKMMQRFCSSLLSDTPIQRVTKQQRRSAPFVVPSMASEQRQQIRSCVAIRIAVSSVSWSRLELPDKLKETNAPCELTDWQHHEINDKKLHLFDLVQRGLYIGNLIPEADCYVFESPQVALASNNLGNAEQQNINVQKSQIEAMLSFALAARRRIIEKQQQSAEQRSSSSSPTGKKKQDMPSNVFFLRRFLTARLFNHLVGNERVSSEQTTLDLMRTFFNVQQQPDTPFNENSLDETATTDSAASNAKTRASFLCNVQFPAELRQVFSAAERYQREFMGQVLLLNLAFVRLVLLQDSKSINKVTRSTTKPIDIEDQSGQL